MGEGGLVEGAVVPRFATAIVIILITTADTVPLSVLQSLRLRDVYHSVRGWLLSDRSGWGWVKC